MLPSHRLALAAALAIGVPAGAAAWVGHRKHALAEHLALVADVPAQIGGVDSDLTGTIRLTDVGFGDLIGADEIEASVSLESILAGELHADEIRVVAPRVSLAIDASGDSDLARLARRLAGAGGSGGGTSRVRRIVVSSGSLVARVAGIGEMSADDVELLPDTGGVRVLTGALHARGEAGPIGIELGFQRAAAELALLPMRFGRVLAVAGTGAVVAGDRKLALHDVAAGRLHDGGALEIAAIPDDGHGRRLAVDVAPHALTVHATAVPLFVLGAIAPPSIDLADARATGTLAIERDHALAITVDGSVDGVRVDHPRSPQRRSRSPPACAARSRCLPTASPSITPRSRSATCAGPHRAGCAAARRCRARSI